MRLVGKFILYYFIKQFINKKIICRLLFVGEGIYFVK